ncbi:MAG: RNA polymerase sigma factor, partial [Myxococcota bacterium]
DEERRQWFARRVEALTDRLYGAALRLARNADDAEDLVAETVVRAWARIAELRDPQAFEAWIRRILNNTFVSEWRHRRARPEVSLAACGEDGGEDSFSLFEQLHQPFLLWWGNPEESAIANLLREDMDRALDALPDAHRVVVVLVDVQGCSYPEAAEVLGVPVGTVRSRLNRARAQLQRALWRHAQEAGLVVGGSNEL